jgi:hypothetical protein
MALHGNKEKKSSSWGKSFHFADGKMQIALNFSSLLWFQLLAEIKTELWELHIKSSFDCKKVILEPFFSSTARVSPNNFQNRTVHIKFRGSTQALHGLPFCDRIIRQFLVKWRDKYDKSCTLWKLYEFMYDAMCIMLWCTLYTNAGIVCWCSRHLKGIRNLCDRRAQP